MLAAKLPRAALVAVTLDVTIRPKDYQLHYGNDPESSGDLVEFLHGMVEDSHALTWLLRNLEPGRVPSEALIHSHSWRYSGAAGFRTMRISFNIAVDRDTWMSRWGLEPHMSLPSHLAAELNNNGTLHRCGMTVCVVGSETGRIIELTDGRRAVQAYQP